MVVELDLVAVGEAAQDAFPLPDRRRLDLDDQRHAPKHRGVDLEDVVGGPDHRHRVRFEQAVEIELGAAAIDQLPGDVLELVEQDRGFETAGEQALKHGKVAQALGAVDLAARHLLFAGGVEASRRPRRRRAWRVRSCRCRWTEQENVDALGVFETGALDQAGDEIEIVGNMLIVGEIERGLERRAEKRVAQRREIGEVVVEAAIDAPGDGKAAAGAGDPRRWFRGTGADRRRRARRRAR